MTAKISYEEFTRRAILKLKTNNYKGIHSVYSGFNDAFRKYYAGVNPVDITTQLANEGKIILRPAKGGVILYLPGDVSQTTKADQALKKMALED